MALVKFLFILYSINSHIHGISAEMTGSPLTQFEKSKQCNDVVLLSQMMAKIENQEARLQKLETTITENRERETERERRISQLETTITENRKRETERERRISQLETTISFYEDAIVEGDKRLAHLHKKLSVYEDALVERDQRLAELLKNNMANENDTAILLEAGNNKRTPVVYTPKEDVQVRYDPNVIKRNSHNLGQVAKETANRKHSARVSPSVTHGVAFCVSVNTASMNLHVNEVIIYNDVMTDIGSGYNQHDGIYTVPESGTYVFTWTTVSFYHSNVGTTIQINGSVEGILGSFGASINNYQSATGVIVKSVTAGDHVYIKISMAGTLVSDSKARSTFSGWRLF